MLVCQKYFKILDVDAEPPCHGNSSLVFVFSNVYAFVAYIVLYLVPWISLICICILRNVYLHLFCILSLYLVNIF